MGKSSHLRCRPVCSYEEAYGSRESWSSRAAASYAELTCGTAGIQYWPLRKEREEMQRTPGDDCDYIADTEQNHGEHSDDVGDAKFLAS